MLNAENTWYMECETRPLLSRWRTTRLYCYFGICWLTSAGKCLFYVWTENINTKVIPHKEKKAERERGRRNAKPVYMICEKVVANSLPQTNCPNQSELVFSVSIATHINVQCWINCAFGKMLIFFLHISFSLFHFLWSEHQEIPRKYIEDKSKHNEKFGDYGEIHIVHFAYHKKNVCKCCQRILCMNEKHII